MAQDEITATFSVGGMPSVSMMEQPQRVDEHSSDDNPQADYGLNESVEVGHDGGVNCYGIDGPAAYGGNKRNTR